MNGEINSESIRRAFPVYLNRRVPGAAYPPAPVPASSLMSDEAECPCLPSNTAALPGLDHLLAAPSRTERTTIRQQRDTGSRGKAGGNSISGLSRTRSDSPPSPERHVHGHLWGKGKPKLLARHCIAARLPSVDRSTLKLRLYSFSRERTSPRAA